jgi:hypothetical protein
VTAETTAPIGLGHQAAAFKLLMQMAVLYPDLPGAYFVVHDVFEVPNSETVFPAEVKIQVDVEHFEAWRIRLGINPQTVTLHTPPTLTWVSADVVLHDVPVHLTGYLSTALTTEQVEAPRVVETDEVPA